MGMVWLLLFLLQAPHTPQDYLKLAQQLDERGALAQRGDLLEEAVQRYPNNPALRFQLAVSWAQRGNLTRALSELRSIPPDQAPDGYWEALGRTFVSMGRFDEGREAFLRHLESHPESVKTMRALTGIALKQQDVETAWEFIQKARILAPASPQVLYDFAQVSLASNRIADAVVIMRVLHLMDPDRPEYIFGLATALVRSQDYPLAVPYFHRYLERRPEDANAQMMMGYALFITNQPEEAISHFDEALKLDPNLIEARHHLGLIAYRQGDDERAISHFEEVLSQDPKHGQAYLNLAKALMRQGEYQEALTQLHQAQKLMPEVSDVYFQLSRTYGQLGESQMASEALATYQELKKAEEAATQRSLNPSPPRR